MAWNPSPQVAVARDAAQKLGKLADGQVAKCIVLYETDDGRFGYASYGRTPNLCRDARREAEQIFKYVMGDTLTVQLAASACPECMALASWLDARDATEAEELPMDKRVQRLVSGLMEIIAARRSDVPKPQSVQDTVNAATVLMPC